MLISPKSYFVKFVYGYLYGSYTHIFIIMPAQGKVSIVWQIIFVLFVPIVGIWAFYRIKKLQKMILYIVLPSLALTVLPTLLLIPFIDDFEDDPPNFDGVSETFGLQIILLYVIIMVGSIGLTAFAIYLIFRWSEEWNSQFDDT